MVGHRRSEDLDEVRGIRRCFAGPILVPRIPEKIGGPVIMERKADGDNLQGGGGQANRNSATCRKCDDPVADQAVHRDHDFPTRNVGRSDAGSRTLRHRHSHHLHRVMAGNRDSTNLIPVLRLGPEGEVGRIVRVVNETPMVVVRVIEALRMAPLAPVNFHLLANFPMSRHRRTSPILHVTIERLGKRRVNFAEEFLDLKNAGSKRLVLGVSSDDVQRVD